ncbi:hypothetical protein [Mesorhizobium sp.]|uniref:hypothetical protein n=1 Tax=Mesorhizobium sp. TaxID=1871066 RepID=UPI000FEA9D07|nr:hypothetical protein [Mesorhizobium sp.]RWE30745.1 MAG: hypothetical protein EOS77_18890 [Mesorhizobium sp.]
MTIPSNFPSHWRQALDARDIATVAFHDEEDAIAFFGETGIYNCFSKLSDDQKMNVVDLRSRFPDESLEAVMRGHAKQRAAEPKGPRFIGAYAGNKPAPTIAQLQPELAAIEREIANMPKPDPWAAAIAKTNAMLKG